MQLSIIAAVVSWSTYEQMPGSGLSHVVIGLGVAWLLTVFPFWIFGLVRRFWIRRKPGVLARNQPTHHDVDLFPPLR